MLDKGHTTGMSVLSKYWRSSGVYLSEAVRGKSLFKTNQRADSSLTTLFFKQFSRVIWVFGSSQACQFLGYFAHDRNSSPAIFGDFSTRSASNTVTGRFPRSFLSEIVMFQQKHPAGQLDRLEN